MPMPLRSVGLPLCCLGLLLSACQRTSPPPSPSPASATAPTVPPSASVPPADHVVSQVARDGQLPVLEVLSEGGQMRDGVLMVDAYERDRVYLGLALETEAGQPLADKTVSVTTDGSSQVLLRQPQTDADGYAEFEVLVGTAGQQAVTVSAAGVSSRFMLNILPNDFDQWLQDLPAEGLTRWGTLMEPTVTPVDGMLRADFPASVQSLAGTTIRVAGFMLSLDPTPQQSHFLLSASPPNCFFHVPGGPSTVIEVFAAKGITGSFDPLVVEGRLELVSESEEGILYRLRDAR